MNALSDSGTASDLSDAAMIFAECRPRLMRVAVRVLGGSGDAEDIVQEAWIRWQTCDRNAVRNVPAFLTTTTTRLALNTLQSARRRHVTYVQSWRPEPVDPRADPTVGLERAESLDLVVRLLLGTLSPTERAAYVLREAFDYPYERVAQLLEQTPANARQLVSRARKHLASGSLSPVNPLEQQRLLHVFVSAAQSGDLTPLEDFLANAVIEGERARVHRAGHSSLTSRTRLAAPVGGLHSAPRRRSPPRRRDNGLTACRAAAREDRGAPS